MDSKTIALTLVIVILSISLVLTNLQNISVDEEDTTPITVDDKLRDVIIQGLKNEIVILGELSDNQGITFELIEHLLIQNDEIICILKNQCDDNSFKKQPGESDKSLNT